MSSESMEQMGFVRICKEAARLLRHHFRMFLPIILAFYLPASFFSVISNSFLVPFLVPAYITGHGGGLKGTHNVLPNSIILSQVFLTPKFIWITPGVVGFTCIVNCIYSNVSDDDGAITWRRVFKVLPFRYTYRRLVVTKFWESLVALLLIAPCILLAFLLNALFSMVTGGGDQSRAVFYNLFVLSQAAGTFALAVLFALAQFVAVLEQENYGLKALKQSSRYARGRAGTIFGVVALGALVDVLVYFLFTRAVATAGQSVPMEIVVASVTEVVAASVISVVFSFMSAYVALVGIVTYFVCKSGSDVAAVSVATAENPYRPLVSRSTQVGEP